MSDARRDVAENEAPTPATFVPPDEVVDTIDAEGSQSGSVVMVHGDIFAAPANSVLIRKYIEFNPL